MSARAYGSDAVTALKKEGTYGVKATGNYTRMPFNSNSLGSERGLQSDPVLGQGRDPYAPQQDVITVDGAVVVPLDLRYIGHWLTGLLGAPVTTDMTTHKRHVWKSGVANLPSYSCEIGHTKAEKHFMDVGVVVDSMESSWSRSGFANATFQLIAQGEEAVSDTSQAGTLQELAYEVFSKFQGAIKKGGANIANLMEGSFKYSNNHERVETIRSDGKIDGVDPTQASLTGNIRARFSDDSLFDSANDGTPIDLEFSYQISATKKITFTAHEVYLPKPKLPVEGPGGIDASFDFQGSKNATAGCMFTVTLLNDVANGVY